MDRKLQDLIEQIQRIEAAGGTVQCANHDGQWYNWDGKHLRYEWQFRQAQPKHYPFDLGRALKGYPVMTRDGAKVDQLIYCAVQSPNGSSGLRLIVSINGHWYYYYDNGTAALIATGAPADLVMVKQIEKVT